MKINVSPCKGITFIYANKQVNAGCYRFILSIISLHRRSRVALSLIANVGFNEGKNNVTLQIFWYQIFVMVEFVASIMF